MAKADNNTTTGFKWLGVARLIELETIERSRGDPTARASAARSALEWVRKGLNEDWWDHRYLDEYGEPHKNDLQHFWSKDDLEMFLGNVPVPRWRRARIFCISCLELRVSDDDLPQDETVDPSQAHAVSAKPVEPIKKLPGKEWILQTYKRRANELQGITITEAARRLAKESESAEDCEKLSLVYIRDELRKRNIWPKKHRNPSRRPQ